MTELYLGYAQIYWFYNGTLNLLYSGYAKIYWFYNGTIILLFLARFCKTLFLPEFLSNHYAIWTRYFQSSQVFCYDFSKTSIVFFQINPRIFWITILLNGKSNFLLTCKMSRYRTMLILKCKRQYLLTCKVGRYCLLACMAVVLNWVHCWFNVGWSSIQCQEGEQGAPMSRSTLPVRFYNKNTSNVVAQYWTNSVYLV